MSGYSIINLEATGKKYASVVNTKLVDIEVKHIAAVSKSTQKIYELSEKVGYQWALLGARKEFGIDEAKERVEGMSKSWIERPIKIVLTKDKRIWGDNTHWTMSYVKKYGPRTKLNEVPFYIVDLREKEPVIVNVKGSVKLNDADITATITAAQEINKRLSLGWRPKGIYYTVADLMKEIWD
ncbi:MAG: hypothetical protein FWE53_02865 [Firmicutes bacterium]|nr:hypothetical protein [Bacillota bacterium]